MGTPGAPEAVAPRPSALAAGDPPRSPATALPDGMVARPALVDRLEAAASKKVVLVVAPPGYGKSTLLAAWAEASHRRIAWLTLAAADDDADRFASRLGAALRPAMATPALAEAAGTPREVGTSFVDLAAAIDGLGPTTIVLDDFHRLTDATLLAEVTELIDRSPPPVRFVLSTRIDPALPSHRWRLDDQLAQLRQGDLLFDAHEAGALLEKITGRTVTEEQLAVLVERTEGWGAGLQLAALSLCQVDDVDRFITAFAGDDRHVSEYLTEHVLRHQPPAVREFLLETSVLDRLTASLCDAVTGRRDGEQLLELACRRSLFVTKLDDQGRWYQCHQLFRDLLRSQLRASRPGAEPELLRRAATWHVDRDEVEVAGAYLVDAGDDGRLLHLVRTHGGDLYRAGRIATVGRWLEHLDPLTRGTEEVALLAAAAAMLAGQTARAGAELDALAARPEPGAPARLVIDHIRTWAAHDEPVSGRVRAAVRQALAAVDVVDAPSLPDVFGLTSLDDVRKGARLNGAAAAAFDGDSATARRLLAEAARVPHTSAPLEIDAAGTEALIDAWAGSLRSAEEHGTRALAVAGQATDRPHPGLAVALLALAHVDRRRNLLDRSQQRLDEARAALNRTEPSVLLALHVAESAELALAVGDLDRGLALLRAHAAAPSPPSPHRVAGLLRAAESRALIGTGDLDRAERILERSSGDASEVHTVAIRLAVERGRFSEARSTLAAWPEDDEPVAGLRRELWGCILDDVDGTDPEDAPGRLGRLVGAADEQGHLRLFLDAGPHAVRLLRGLYHRAPTPFLRRVVDSSATLSLVPAHPVDRLVEQLSERERAVLGLLPSSLDNAEIAALLGVSANTLKTHLKHIYQKLDVTSRRGAILAAEDLYLL